VGEKFEIYNYTLKTYDYNIDKIDNPQNFIDNLEIIGKRECDIDLYCIGNESSSKFKTIFWEFEAKKPGVVHLDICNYAGNINNEDTYSSYSNIKIEIK